MTRYPKQNSSPNLPETSLGGSTLGRLFKVWVRENWSLRFETGINIPMTAPLFTFAFLARKTPRCPVGSLVGRLVPLRFQVHFTPLLPSTQCPRARIVKLNIIMENSQCKKLYSGHRRETSGDTQICRDIPFPTWFCQQSLYGLVSLRQTQLFFVSFFLFHFSLAPKPRKATQIAIFDKFK